MGGSNGYVFRQAVLGSNMDYGLLLVAISVYIFSVACFRFFGTTINWMLADADDAPNGHAGTFAVLLNAVIILLLCFLYALFRAESQGIFWTHKFPNEPFFAAVSIFITAVSSDPRTFAVGLFSMSLAAFFLAISKLIAIRIAGRPKKSVTLFNWSGTSSYLPGLPSTGNKDIFTATTGPSSDALNKEASGWWKRVWVHPVGSKLWSNLIWAAGNLVLSVSFVIIYLLVKGFS